VTKVSKEAMKRIATLSGYSENTVSDIFDTVVIYALLQQLDGLPFVIPNVGEVVLAFQGDEMTVRGKKAIVKIDVAPDDYLARCVGQIHDGCITDAEIRMRNLNIQDLGDVLGTTVTDNLPEEEEVS
jgi:hypothetical protein